MINYNSKVWNWDSEYTIKVILYPSDLLLAYDAYNLPKFMVRKLSVFHRRCHLFICRRLLKTEQLTEKQPTDMGDEW